MKLQPDERSILAAFSSAAAAAPVQAELESRGFTVQLDRTSTFGSTPHDRQLNNPISGEARTLSGLTLYLGRDVTTRDVGPLLAAHPAASGMSGEGLPTHNYLLTVVGSAARVEEALKVIREGGGLA